MTAAVDVAQSGTISSSWRNRIINGAMTIDQRNAGASVTPTTTVNGFPVDRFLVTVTQNSKLTTQQSTVAPSGFNNSMLVTSSSAYSILSSDVFAIRQSIEGFNFADFGFGTASASAVTLSFWVRSSLTGTFGGALGNYAATRSYPFTYTVNTANTFEYKTVTIAGDTSGTWVGASSAGAASIWFGLGVGATSSGTAGAWAGADYRSATGATSVVGTNGATFYVTGVQLEAGSAASPFEYRDYGRELIMCQRYLPAFIGNGNWFGFGLASGTTQVWTTVQFPVTTRVAPTGITVSAAADFTITDAIAAAIAASSITFNSASQQSSLLLGTASSAVLTNLRPTTLTSNSANSKLLFTGCEL
jgi:hypothetical protein